MPSSRVDRSGGFSPIHIQGHQVEMRLDMESVAVRRNGIEFRSATPMPVWREMTVEFSMGSMEGPIKCNGIVVSCSGDKYIGYAVCMLFLSLAPSAEQQWCQFVESRLA